MKIKNIAVILTLVGLLLTGGFALTIYFEDQSSSQIEEPMAAGPIQEAPKTPDEIYPYTISPQSTLFTVLTKLKINPQVINEIVTAAKPVMNLSRIRPGTQFQLFHTDSTEAILAGIKFRFSPVEKLVINKIN